MMGMSVLSSPSATIATLVGGCTEVQLVLLVLSIMVIGVALLSYFVIAPEYEKHLEKQHAAIVLQTTQNYVKSSRSTPTGRTAAARSPVAIVKAHEKREADAAAQIQDVEAAFSDDDVFENDSTDSEPVDPLRRRSIGTVTQSDLSRRRKSESDALRQTSVGKAEMLRRRLLLRKLELEINGAIQETNAKTQGSTPRGKRTARLVRRDSCELSEERLKMIQDHPVDCAQELGVLASATNLDEIKDALQTIHDVLTYYLSFSHRDMNKVTVFCNSLLKYDGLNHLRGFEISPDAEVRTLAVQIIEKAVPAIWH